MVFKYQLAKISLISGVVSLIIIFFSSGIHIYPWTLYLSWFFNKLLLLSPFGINTFFALNIIAFALGILSIIFGFMGYRYTTYKIVPLFGIILGFINIIFAVVIRYIPQGGYYTMLQSY